MRLLGLVGLVLALLIVGLLARKQVSTLAPSPAALAPEAGRASPMQGRQLQEEVRKSLDAALQQPRPMPDDSQ